MRSEKSDVIVLGGGVAGLAAARRVSAAGLTVTVVEARPRHGGRVHTLHEAQWPAPIELGAEFIHGELPETWGRLRFESLRVCDASGENWQSFGSRLLLIKSPLEELRQILRRLPRRAARDESFARFLETRCRNQPRRRRELAKAFVEGFHAAPVEDAGVLALAAESETEVPMGSGNFRLTQGYDSIVRWLVAGIDLSKSTLLIGKAARAVRWRRGRVRVELEDAQHRPRLAIPTAGSRQGRHRAPTSRVVPP